MPKAKKRFEQVPVDEVLRRLQDKVIVVGGSEGTSSHERGQPVRDSIAPRASMQKPRAKRAIRSGEESPFA
jgi:hypothetical protein